MLMMMQMQAQISGGYGTHHIFDWQLWDGIIYCCESFCQLFDKRMPILLGLAELCVVHCKKLSISFFDHFA